MIRQRTYDEIRQSIRNNIHDKDERVDTKAGTFVSDVLICPQADELASAYIDMKLMELNQSILTATGYDLDRLGMNYFTFRRGAKKSHGRVRFYVTNSNRPNLTVDMLPEEISIPVNFKIATQGSSTSTQVVFKTLDSAYMSARQIYNSGLVDEATGYKFVELEVECDIAGKIGNVDAYAISETYGETLDGIVAISNPLSCNGGEDAESDSSLQMRIMLAVLGASICTKNGYLKWVIQKDNVNDAVVVGAGDDIMFRDGGFINSANSYVYGRGGMVDIWVRGKQPQTKTLSYSVTTSYKTGIGQADGYEGIPCHDIVLPDQPVLKVESIISRNTGYVFENAENYQIEYGYTGTKIERTYYKDILWDFSVTESFNDTEFYPLDVLDKTEIEVLRKQVNAELQSLVDEMENMNYSLNWKLAQYEDLSSYSVTPMFRKVFFNGSKNKGMIYKIIAVDKRLNGRTFIKKNNRIYLRVYQDPDYALVPTIYSDEEKIKTQLGKDVGGSILASDLIHFTDKGKEKIQEGDTLEITYSYNMLIMYLQAEINAMRILTADILVRQAQEVKLQIIINCTCDYTEDTTIVRKNIMTAISTYVNSMKRMGSLVEDSELVTIARTSAGVNHVDINNVTLCRKGRQDVDMIQLQANEYFLIDSLVVNVSTGNTVNN